MLASEQRIRSSREFGRVVRQGRRAGTSTLVVHFLVGSESSESRMGLIVGKTVGGAVVRNRVKRRLRELIRGRLSALPPGSLLVVRGLPPAGSATTVQLGSDLDDALGRVRAT